jgi:hypoxanthine-DNA glycosylase
MNICFPAVSTVDARVLILGSFPGDKSLVEQHYYAHSRNVFWKVMAEIAGFSEKLEYEKKVEHLEQSKIALWDVIKSCRRSGSVDSNIVSSSIVTNDFNSFLSIHPEIRMIFFNGSRAEKEFKKRVLPHIDKRSRSIGFTRLPSTSPAMAMMTYQQKLMAWSVIRNYL